MIKADQTFYFFGFSLCTIDFPFALVHTQALKFLSKGWNLKLLEIKETEKNILIMLCFLQENQPSIFYEK